MKGGFQTKPYATRTVGEEILTDIFIKSLDNKITKIYNRFKYILGADMASNQIDFKKILGPIKPMHAVGQSPFAGGFCKFDVTSIPSKAKMFNGFFACDTESEQQHGQ